MDDFSKYPKSVNELNNNGNAANWTPREALISVLRKIDSGELDPTALMVISMTRESDGHTSTYYTSAGPDLPTSIGMLEIAKMRLFEG